MEVDKKNGLVIVHTGSGKGKTTAAIGLAVRAWGQGLRVLILQFIKGGWKYGELKALQKFSPQMEIRQLGEGFTQRGSDQAKRERDCAAADVALQTAVEEIHSGNWDMIILDEINYAVKFGLVEEEQVLSLLEQKPASLHLVLTGREARPAIIEQADLVTEMTEIKHPYAAGIKAQAGIEF
ncbi:MAG: cob(I)yrinic acid a,c-diamide adenosyltransferase [Selenomonadaceae bacterium]